MRILLSTIGSRGDVQPLVALASELRALGQDVHLCVPPDFREWIEGLGMSVTPIGPELRGLGKVKPTGASFTPEQRQQMIDGTIATQFDTIAKAAEGCELIVGATALQIAAPSVAEKIGIPYVFVSYCPAVLPSPHHAPPVLAALGDTPAAELPDYSALWAEDAKRWNDGWSAPLNARRTSLELAPVSEVRDHVLTERPWLAADRALAPWPETGSASVLQSGAWILADTRPLSDELTAFLDAGDAPVYVGFGSCRAPSELSRAAIESVRALKRRAIVSHGWADLQLVDDASDCIAIDEVNQQALFPRVAAVVHHGGAGTTTAAARAGVPQVVIPQHYDQHYWAQRVRHLGIGVAHDASAPTTESLTHALETVLSSDVEAQAAVVARSVRGDGARLAAEHLVAAYCATVP